MFVHQLYYFDVIFLSADLVAAEPFRGQWYKTRNILPPEIPCSNIHKLLVSILISPRQSAFSAPGPAS